MCLWCQTLSARGLRRSSRIRGVPKAIANRRHPEHRSMLEWAGGVYDPDAFDPKAVVFDNPRKRWKKAFER